MLSETVFHSELPNLRALRTRNCKRWPRDPREPLPGMPKCFSHAFFLKLIHWSNECLWWIWSWTFFLLCHQGRQLLYGCTFAMEMKVLIRTNLAVVLAFRESAHGVTWFPAVAPVIRGLYGDWSGRICVIHTWTERIKQTVRKFYGMYMCTSVQHNLLA
jgi:hypothetical protein